jgi:hypothetical protein
VLRMVIDCGHNLEMGQSNVGLVILGELVHFKHLARLILMGGTS